MTPNPYINIKNLKVNGSTIKLKHSISRQGKGYLYANSDTLMLNFTGVPNNGDGSVVLHKTGDGESAGWNLVGNPFNERAYIDREFYVMSVDGSRIELAQRDYVLPMEGVFVIANEDGEVLVFRRNR